VYLITGVDCTTKESPQKMPSHPKSTQTNYQLTKLYFPKITFFLSHADKPQKSTIFL
jgi:hypothetical protein